MTASSTSATARTIVWQVFTKEGRFVREVVIARETLGSGSVWDVGFSTDRRQEFLFINDGTNQLIYVLDRQTLQGRQHFRRRRALGRTILWCAQSRRELEGGFCSLPRRMRASGCRNSPTPVWRPLCVALEPRSLRFVS